MSQYSSKYNSYLQGNKPNVFSTKFSGGALMDLNVYNIHFMTSIFGYPQDLNYTATIRDGIDFGGTLTFKYDDMIACLTSCKNTKAQSNIQIQGEKGYILINSAASMVNSFDLYQGSEKTTYNIQEDGLKHHYYMQYLMNIMQQNDYEKCIERLNHTLEVEKILVKARKSANIIFEDDK